MLHLTGPHLWLLSVPHLSSALFSVHLGCSVCDTHFPSQCRVVVVILCFFRPLLSLCRSLLAFSVSVTALFVNVIADYNTEATMSAWARVYMCVCVCVTCGYKCKSHERTPACLVCGAACVCECIYARVSPCVCPPCSCVLMHGRRWIPPAAAIEGCCPLLFRTKHTN